MKNEAVVLSELFSDTEEEKRYLISAFRTINDLIEQKRKNKEATDFENWLQKAASPKGIILPLPHYLPSGTHWALTLGVAVISTFAGYGLPLVSQLILSAASAGVTKIGGGEIEDLARKLIGSPESIDKDSIENAIIKAKANEKIDGVSTGRLSDLAEYVETIIPQAIFYAAKSARGYEYGKKGDPFYFAEVPSLSVESLLFKVSATQANDAFLLIKDRTSAQEAGISVWITYWSALDRYLRKQEIEKFEMPHVCDGGSIQCRCIEWNGEVHNEPRLIVWLPLGDQISPKNLGDYIAGTDKTRSEAAQVKSKALWDKRHSGGFRCSHDKWPGKCK